MTYQGARGKYGDYSPDIHDLTGKRHMAAMEDKENRQKAVSATVNALNSGEPVTIVPIRGGRVYAVPTEVYDRIFELGASQ